MLGFFEVSNTKYVVLTQLLYEVSLIKLIKKRDCLLESHMGQELVI